MTVYAFFSFVAFLLYLQAAIYFYRMMPGTKANRVFVLALTSLAIISAFIFARQFIDELKYIYYLDRLAVMGWISFPILANYYITLASGSHTGKRIMHVIYFILAPIAAYLLARYIIHPQSLKDFYRADSGIWYFNTSTRAAWTIVAIIYGFINTWLGVYVMYQWMKKSKKGRYIKDKIKTWLIFISVLLFLAITASSVVIAPLTGRSELPSMMHIAALPTMTTIFLTTLFLHPRNYFREMISDIFIKRIREFVFYLDHNGKVYSVNDYSLERLGYLPLEIVNKEADFFFKPAKIINQQIEDVAMNIPGRQVISLLSPKNDDPITVSLSVTKVYDDFRNMLGFIIIARDYQQTHELYKENKIRMRMEQRLAAINQELETRIHAKENTLLHARDKLKIEVHRQQEAEQKIINELRTKEKILYEIHHRVKNNMQMIVSLLNLELNKYGTSEHVRKTYAKLAGRVHDISVIHDYLYNAPYLGKINFNFFLQRTTDDLKGRFPKINNLFFNISASQDLMTIDQAIPCGIIIYELTHNSLQHAFADHLKPGTKNPSSMYAASFPAIHIEFFRKEDKFSMHVADNGCGICLHDGKPENKNTGLDLVELLVTKYLNGEITYDAENGTKVHISFPVSADGILTG